MVVEDWRRSKMRLARVCCCTLDQWSMDFAGNLRRIRKSLLEAKEGKARYRLGSELELCGYGCEDHFLEQDTETHAWEVLAQIIVEGLTDDMLCDFGILATHRGARFNCRVFVLDGNVLLIRPKSILAGEGNYREGRYFAAWPAHRPEEEFSLPRCMVDVSTDKRKTVPIGLLALRLNDATLAAETCEELFAPRAPHRNLALSGVDLITNGSGSHHCLRKLDRRLELIRSATKTGGGVYLYANQRGCDGGRLYYDGCSCVVVNGELVAQGKQFDVKEVEVVHAVVNLDAVLAYRGSMASLREQSAMQAVEFRPPRFVPVDFSLCMEEEEQALHSPTGGIVPRIHAVEEEIALGPACWLWDYLRRSGARGFLLPLSGGADSSAVAAIVYSMSKKVAQEMKRDPNGGVARDLARILRREDAPLPCTAQEITGELLNTVYLATEHSSKETKDRAARLAHQIGARHSMSWIDRAVQAILAIAEMACEGQKPRFRSEGGSATENAALQNVQARLRMVLAFLLAQLLPWARGEKGRFLLVLGSANVDECLRGYLTKYDCSSADINPIGGISKTDLRRFLRWASLPQGLDLPVLGEVEAAPPTAELEPLGEDGSIQQTDEEDMGMTYLELSAYGRLRSLARAGPVSMFETVYRAWQGISPRDAATKVKHFFRHYAINRHKATTLTPAYHAEDYSPEDHRFDHRPFLYEVHWKWQFRIMDKKVSRIEGMIGPSS